MVIDTVHFPHKKKEIKGERMADFKLNYIRSEELKQEYICRKELTYSEKLLIEDFFNWLFK